MNAKETIAKIAKALDEANATKSKATHIKHIQEERPSKNKY